MKEERTLWQDRKNKLKLWSKQGFGFAEKFDRTHTSTQAREYVSHHPVREIDSIVSDPRAAHRLCGRIKNVREMGKLAFLRLLDVDGDFQLCFAKQVLEDDFKKFLKLLDLGDFCGFEGEFFITKHGEPSLLVTKIHPLSKSLRPLPEKFHGLQDTEACYRERHLDLISNKETFDRFRIRSQIVQEIRQFFLNRDFLEIESRILQPQAGGAMADVFRTHHNALDHEFVLRISLELDHKMAVGGGMERVFEIGKCFRNEGIDPSHLQEFTLLEWYAAYKDIQINMQWTQELLQQILKNVIKSMVINVCDKDGHEHEIDFSAAFKIARFDDLLKEHANVDMHTISDSDLIKVAQSLGVEKTEKVSRANLLDDVYKKTARPLLIQPTFVMDYPTDLKPLARPKEDGTSDCFQLLVAGWEIVNSYNELIDPLIQRKLLEKQTSAKEAGDSEAMEIDEVFLKAMEHGLPPMTGSGIGIDRLVALFTGQSNLRDTVLFPLMRPL